jgi:hypothetical protein
LDDKGKPVAVPVRAGLTDNTFTEVTAITEGSISEGMQILVGVNEVRGTSSAPAAASPFQMGGRR